MHISFFAFMLQYQQQILIKESQVIAKMINKTITYFMDLTSVEQKCESNRQYYFYNLFQSSEERIMKREML